MKDSSSSPVLTAMVAIVGDYCKVYQHIERLLQEIAENYNSRSNAFELILVLHGDGWLRVLPFHSMSKYGVKILVVEVDEDLPAVLFNCGALSAEGNYLSFAWPGIEIPSWLNFLQKMSDELASGSRAAFYAGRPAMYNMRDDAIQSWKGYHPGGVFSRYPGGWLEMLDYAPMSGSFISREYFLKLGGFSCSPLLQRGFWWEFTVRAARFESIDSIDTATPEGMWSWSNYPLTNDLPLSGDLIARRVVRRKSVPDEVMQECDWDDLNEFTVDLPVVDRRRIDRLTQQWLLDRSTASRNDRIESSASITQTAPEPLKVVILCGLNEPAHNQICFFNYFSLLEGKGVLTWRAILDISAHPVDLLKSDLVIFSRVKSEQGCRLMDYCNENKIPTVYMLDDNWFSISNDWPKEYAHMFSPGAPVYEQFMHCLVRADWVLTYNKVLAEDLLPHCRQLETLPTNIDLSLFPDITRPGNKRMRVGYVGSPRKELSAFIALSELAAEREDFDVFVMSSAIPDILQDLPDDRLIFHPYIFDYIRYAKVVCEAMPDVLMAPLGNTRTEASKCPNKYLEITAAKAIGIYSHSAVYDQFITDGENGLLVRNGIDAWKTAIEFILDNPSNQSKILANAQDDVRSNFDTSVVLPAFMNFLTRAAGMVSGRSGVAA